MPADQPGNGCEHLLARGRCGRACRDPGRQRHRVGGGLNSLTIIVGFAVFVAIRRALAFDKRLVFAGYRPAALIGAKITAITVLAAAVPLYTASVLLFFWRPSPPGWAGARWRE